MEDLRQYGRNGDTELVHMSPAEVGGLAAMSPTGSLPVNPVTGYPEANILKSILPIAGALAGNFIAPGVGMAPWLGAGIGAFGGSMLGGASLQQGIMNGLLGGVAAYGLGSMLGGPAEAIAATGGDAALAAPAAASAAPAGTATYASPLNTVMAPSGAIGPAVSPAYAATGAPLNTMMAPSGAIGPAMSPAYAAQTGISAGNAAAAAEPGFFTRAGEWISENPFQAASAGLIGVSAIGGLADSGPEYDELPGLPDREYGPIPNRETANYKVVREMPPDEYPHGFTREWPYFRDRFEEEQEARTLGFAEGGIVAPDFTQFNEVHASQFQPAPVVTTAAASEPNEMGLVMPPTGYRHGFREMWDYYPGGNPQLGGDDDTPPVDTTPTGPAPDAVSPISGTTPGAIIDAGFENVGEFRDFIQEPETYMATSGYYGPAAPGDNPPTTEQLAQRELLKDFIQDPEAALHTREIYDPVEINRIQDAQAAFNNPEQFLYDYGTMYDPQPPAPAPAPAPAPVVADPAVVDHSTSGAFGPLNPAVDPSTFTTPAPMGGIMGGVTGGIMPAPQISHGFGSAVGPILSNVVTSPAMQDAMQNTATTLPSQPLYTPPAWQLAEMSRPGMTEQELYGYQEGGIVAEAAAQPTGDERMQIVEEARMAIQGSHPEPEKAIERFLAIFGPQALEALRSEEIKRSMQPQQELPTRAVSGPQGVDQVPARIDGRQEARLSNDEVVFSKDAVRASGDGDIKEGQQRLLALNNALMRKGGRPDKQMPRMPVEQVAR